jgi:hypothetical protein
MIRLELTEQELFDLIMTLYADGAAEYAQQSPETAQRREALLERLHDAFDDKVLLAQLEDRQAIPVRVGQRHATADTRD